MDLYSRYFGIESNSDDYYVNLNTGEHGEHEIHKGDCSYLPEPENRLYLGKNRNYNEAKISAMARLGYDKKFDGCGHCCPENHTC